MFWLEDAKRRLEITSGDWDDMLQDMIDATRAAADDYMGVRYSSVTEHSEYHDGGGSTLYLGHVNVSNLTLSVDGDEYDEDDYTLYPEEGRVQAGASYASFDRADNGATWPSGLRRIKATYDGGYTEDDMPAGLRGKLLKQVVYEFRRRKDPGLSSVQYPDGNIQKQGRQLWQLDEWLPDVAQELNRRRRVWL